MLSTRSTIEMPPTSPRLPLALAGAAVVAGVSHFLNAEKTNALAVFLVAILASYLTSWRLPRNRAFTWGLRAVVYGGILMIVGLPKEEAVFWYVKFEYTDRIGHLLAAELVLRAWRQPDPDRAARERGDIMLISALLMTASANTYDRRMMQLLAPVYTLFLLLSLRTLTPSRSRGDSGRARSYVGGRPALVVLRAVSMVLAIAMGFLSVYLIARFDRKITNWAMRLMRQDGNRRSEIGLSSAPRLQAVFNPTPSMTRMLLIDGPRGERHLRAMAFDTYTASGWRPELGEREFKPVSAGELKRANVGTRLRVTRLEDTMDLLLLPLESGLVETTAAVERDGMGTLRTADSIDHPSYEVVITDRATLHAPPDDAQRQKLLAINPDIDPKVVELARSVAGEGDPATRLARIGLHLRSKHQYSLSFSPEGEPLSDFVLNNRSAHCQYFASAVVIMARAAGIPARFVTGYYAHEAYGEGRMVVRDRDAHAWAECWIDGKGWVAADATPAGGRPDFLFPQVSPWKRWWERATDMPGAVRAWLGRLGVRDVVVGGAVAGGAVTLLWLIPWLRKTRTRRKVAVRMYDPPAAELVAVGKRFERILRRRGVPCASDRTWREHVTALPGKPADGIDSDKCLEFVNVYDRARFGGVNGETMQRVVRLLESLESSPS